MASTATPVFKSMSMLESTCLLTLPSFFTTTKNPYPILSVTPSKPIKLHISCSHSSLFSLRNKTHFSSIATFVTQNSDWAQQEAEDNNTLTINQEEPIWENREVDGTEGSDEEGTFKEREEEEEEEGEGEEESFVEPPEDAKLFVGNLPYDVDSQKLAVLFEQVGTVEIAEVKFMAFLFFVKFVFFFWVFRMVLGIMEVYDMCVCFFWFCLCGCRFFTIGRLIRVVVSGL